MKKITTITIEETNINIYMSKHAIERLTERFKSGNINEYTIAGNILMLGKKLLQHCKNGDEVAIIDTNNNFAVIAGCKNNFDITVITLIDKACIYVKNDTSIENI